MRARVLLINPKYPHNVGGAYRAAACFGAESVFVVGNRVPLEPTEGYPGCPARSGCVATATRCS